jgi:hypothetical protein
MKTNIIHTGLDVDDTRTTVVPEAAHSKGQRPDCSFWAMLRLSVTALWPAFRRVGMLPGRILSFLHMGAGRETAGGYHRPLLQSCVS